MKRIVITFDEDGKAQISTTGFRGKSCVAEVEKIQQDVAAHSGVESRTEKVTYTSEYYQQQQQQTERKQAAQAGSSG